VAIVLLQSAVQFSNAVLLTQLLSQPALKRASSGAGEPGHFLTAAAAATYKLLSATAKTALQTTCGGGKPGHLLTAAAAAYRILSATARTALQTTIDGIQWR
jgi:hypothetical protein